MDTSASAIQQARHNAALNGLPATQYTFEREDIQDFLKDHLRDSPELPQAWDMVVLDPPKLAPNRKSLDKANSMYRKLNGLVRAGSEQACVTLWQSSLSRAWTKMTASTTHRVTGWKQQLALAVKGTAWTGPDAALACGQAEADAETRRVEGAS